MEYNRTFTLKDGRKCILRNANAEDGAAVLDLYILTHGQTDYLLSYPDEVTFTPESESEYLRKKAESPRDVELLAIVDGVAAGSAGVFGHGEKFKVRDRASLGISVDKRYWRLGIGKALIDACIECAKKAGYRQMELEVVAENEAAIALYKKAGFVEFGRNPRGMKSRETGWQEIVLMRLEM